MAEVKYIRGQNGELVPLTRQLKWKLKRWQEGRCVECGKFRGRSPYKRKCRECGEKDVERHREKYGLKEWRPGGKGRPPLNAKRSTKNS